MYKGTELIRQDVDRTGLHQRGNELHGSAKAGHTLSEARRYSYLKKDHVIIRQTERVEPLLLTEM
jgi:hypothetical protein